MDWVLPSYNSLPDLQPTFSIHSGLFHCFSSCITLILTSFRLPVLSSRLLSILRSLPRIFFRVLPPCFLHHFHRSFRHYFYSSFLHYLYPTFHSPYPHYLSSLPTFFLTYIYACYLGIFPLFDKSAHLPVFSFSCLQGCHNLQHNYNHTFHLYYTVARIDGYNLLRFFL